MAWYPITHYWYIFTLMESALNSREMSWPIDLVDPPGIARVGVGRHGLRTRSEEWWLPDLWSIHLYSYYGDLYVGDHHLPITPGSVSVVPPGAAMRFEYRGPSTHLFAHLRAGSTQGRQRIAAGRSLGADHGAVRSLWEDAVAAFPLHTHRARADLWGLLWRLVVVEEPSPLGVRPSPHPVVTSATGHLEMHLAEPPTVPELARLVGVSHNHLTRLFQRELSCTVAGYIRRRRIQQAEHMLIHSTLAISSIAAVVGISDLQAFNKAVRRELGSSPRTIRATAGRRSGSQRNTPPSAIPLEMNRLNTR